MRYLAIILFLFLVVPVAVKEYQKDKGKNIVAKALNVIISIIIFLSFSGTVKQRVVWLFENQSLIKSAIFVKVGLLNPFLSGLIWFIHLALSFELLAVSIMLIIRKEKYRKLLLRLIPFWWIIESAHMYKYILSTDAIPNSDNLIPVILLTTGIVFLLLFLFYKSNFIKRFFQFNTNNPPM